MVTIAPDPGWVRVVCHTDAEVPTWPPDGVERTLAAQVLHGLADEVSWTRTDGRPAVRIGERGIGPGRDA